jgi:hypothetical protein
MRQQFTSFVLIVCGAFVLALGLSLAPSPVPAAASPALQPSPRPTLVPTADIIPGRDRESAPAAFGRITGTVIDARTGTPVPGRLVMIGEQVAISDATAITICGLPQAATTCSCSSAPAKACPKPSLCRRW